MKWNSVVLRPRHIFDEVDANQMTNEGFIIIAKKKQEDTFKEVAVLSDADVRSMDE